MLFYLQHVAFLAPFLLGCCKSFYKCWVMLLSCRLAEEAVNNERIANLKERVSMLECERERERMAALSASMKFNNSDRDDEMLNRIQQLESALQQAHEDYRLLSQGFLEFSSLTFWLLIFVLCQNVLSKTIQNFTTLGKRHGYSISW